jgi:hypothetical protein
VEVIVVSLTWSSGLASATVALVIAVTRTWEEFRRLPEPPDKGKQGKERVTSFLGIFKFNFT